MVGQNAKRKRITTNDCWWGKLRGESPAIKMGISKAKPGDSHTTQLKASNHNLHSIISSHFPLRSHLSSKQWNSIFPSSYSPSNGKSLYSEWIRFPLVFLQKITKLPRRKEKRMRFLFELVPCCGSPTRRSQEPVVPSEDEERWLVSLPATAAAPSRRGGRKKQRKPGAPDWRPSLGSISEDLTPAPKPVNGAAAAAGKGSKKRSAVGGGVKVHHPSYSDRYSGSVLNLINKKQRLIINIHKINKYKLFD